MSELRYATDGSVTTEELWAPWSMVTNQVGVKAERVVGELCQLVELMNLPEKQEKTFKAKLKQAVYAGANDSLDLVCEALRQAKGEMPYLNGGTANTPRVTNK